MCGRLPFGKGFRDVDAKLVGCSHVSGLSVAARMAAGPNAIHGSGPSQKQALEAPWLRRVSPTPGSTDFALRHIHSAKLVYTILAGDLSGKAAPKPLSWCPTDQGFAQTAHNFQLSLLLAKPTWFQNVQAAVSVT